MVPQSTLVVSFAEFGLAGLTAVAYLVDQFALIQTSHLEGLDVDTTLPEACAAEVRQHDTELAARIERAQRNGPGRTDVHVTALGDL